MLRTVWVEPRTKPDTFSVQYYHPETGKHMRVKADSKAEMKKVRNRLESMLLNWEAGNGDPGADPQAVLGEFLLDRARRECTPRTIKMYKDECGRFISRPDIKAMRDITKKSILTWVDECLKRGLRQSTIAIRLRSLRAFLTWCHEDKKIRENPTEGITITEGEPRGRKFTLKELQDLLAGCPAWFRPYFILDASTGCRTGELLQMAWEDVDLDHGAWNIPMSKTKSRADRTIPLPKAAQEALRSILGDKDADMRLGPVFDWKPSKVYWGWKQTKIAAGIKHVPFENRPHDLRHSFASHFRGRWPSLKAICGWKTDEMAGRYTHTDFEELKEDMGKFGVDLGQIEEKGEEKRG